MSQAGISATPPPSDDSLKRDFLAARAQGGGDYNWILNSGSASQGAPAAELRPRPAAAEGGPSSQVPAAPSAATVQPELPFGLQFENSLAKIKALQQPLPATGGLFEGDVAGAWNQLKQDVLAITPDPKKFAKAGFWDQMQQEFQSHLAAGKSILDAANLALSPLTGVADEAAGAIGKGAAALIPGLPARAVQDAISKSLVGIKGAPELAGASETAAEGASAEGAASAAPKAEPAAAPAPESPEPAFTFEGAPAGKPVKPADVPPQIRQQALDYLSGKRADNPIQASLLTLSDDKNITQTISDIAKFLPPGEVKPDDVLRMGAYSLNMDEGTLARGLRGQLPSDEEIGAWGLLVNSSAKELQGYAQAALEGDEAAREKFVQGFAIQNKLIGDWRDVGSEQGRAFRARQLAWGTRNDLTAMIHDMIERAGQPAAGEAPVDASALDDAMRKIASFDDPEKVNPFLSSLRWMKTREGMLYGWYNWLLSNPMVVAKKIATDHLTAIWNTAATYAAEKFGSGAVEPGETANLISGYLGAYGDSLRAAGKALKAGESQFMGDQRTLDGLQRTRLSMMANGIDPDAPPSATNAAANYLKSAMPTSWMGAADDFGKTFHYRATARQLLWREGVGKGLTGDELAGYVSDGLNNIAPHIHEQAVAAAQRETLTEPLALIAQKAQDLVDAANIGPVPLGRMVMPFMRIGANATRYAFRWSPLGFALPSVQADIAAGGAARDLAYARIGLGTGLAATGATLAAGGLLTGRGPSDPQLQRAWRAAGNEPYSIKLPNGKWLSIGIEPIATGLGIIADTADILRYAHEQDQTQTAWSLVFGIGNAMTSRSYNQGIANFLDALHNPDSDAKRYGDNLLASIAMPPGANFIREQFDPFVRAHYGLLDAIAARTPGLSRSLPPLRSLWGDPIQYGADPAPQPIDSWVWNNRAAFPEADQGRIGLTAPGQVQSYDAGNHVSAQIRLTPQQLDRLKVLAGNALKGPHGLGARDALNALVQGTYPDAAEQAMFSNASPAKQALIVLRVFNAAKNAAKRQLATENPDIAAAINQGFAAKRQQLTQSSAPTLGGNP